MRRGHREPRRDSTGQVVAAPARTAVELRFLVPPPAPVLALVSRAQRLLTSRFNMNGRKCPSRVP